MSAKAPTPIISEHDLMEIHKIGMEIIKGVPLSTAHKILKTKGVRWFEVFNIDPWIASSDRTTSDNDKLVSDILNPLFDDELFVVLPVFDNTAQCVSTTSVPVTKQNKTVRRLKESCKLLAETVEMNSGLLNISYELLYSIFPKIYAKHWADIEHTIMKAHSHEKISIQNVIVTNKKDGLFLIAFFAAILLLSGHENLNVMFHTDERRNAFLEQVRELIHKHPFFKCEPHFYVELELENGIMLKRASGYYTTLHTYLRGSQYFLTAGATCVIDNLEDEDCYWKKSVEQNWPIIAMCFTDS